MTSIRHSTFVKNETFGLFEFAMIEREWDGRAGRGIAILGAAVMLAVLSQFYRSSLGVIAPELMADVSLSVEEFGALTGAFFIIFAVLQIPIGVLLDRFGGRALISTMMVLAILGSYILSTSNTYESLLVARVLIGAGCAGIMVGSLVILRNWFSSRSFTMAMGVLFASANAGNLAATSPLAWAADAFGWRPTFVGLSVIATILTLIYAIVVRDYPPGSSESGEAKTHKLSQVAKGLLEVWTNRNLPYVFVMVAVGYSTIITVLGVWGGPYLHDAFGLDTVQRGNVLSLMAVASILGTLIYGPLDRWFDTKKGVVTVGATATALLFAGLAIWPNGSIWYSGTLLILLGLIGAYSLVVMAHGVALFPSRLAGRGVTTLNISLMGGAAVLQWGSGQLMGMFASDSDRLSETAYSALFASLCAVTLVALIVYRMADDVRPSDANATD